VKHSTGVMVLAAALVVNVVLAILLTPLGFESRPATDLTTWGYVAVGAVFAGLILDLAAIVFLVRGQTRLASILAIIGSVLFVLPNVVDRTGSFFTMPIPPVINILEYIFMVVLIVTIFLAWRVYAESTPDPS